MKYYEDTLYQLRIARMLKKAKMFRDEGDYMKACAYELEARFLFGADVLFKHTNKSVIESCLTAPIGEIEKETIESIRFFHNGFRYHLKHKHEK